MALVSSYTEAGIRSVTGGPVVGQPGDVHDSAKNEVGCLAYDQFDNQYVYLGGAANVVEGMAVTYEEDGVVTLLAAAARGPVAWATGAIVATKFGWYARQGNILGRVVTSTADDAVLGKETTAGEIGDGFAAGDQIKFVISRAANASGATVLQKIQTSGSPYVDDSTTNT